MLGGTDSSVWISHESHLRATLRLSGRRCIGRTEPMPIARPEYAHQSAGNRPVSGRLHHFKDEDAESEGRSGEGAGGTSGRRTPRRTIRLPGSASTQRPEARVAGGEAPASSAARHGHRGHDAEPDGHRAASAVHQVGAPGWITRDPPGAARRRGPRPGRPALDPTESSTCAAPLNRMDRAGCPHRLEYADPSVGVSHEGPPGRGSGSARTDRSCGPSPTAGSGWITPIHRRRLTKDAVVLPAHKVLLPGCT